MAGLVRRRLDLTFDSVVSSSGPTADRSNISQYIDIGISTRSASVCWHEQEPPPLRKSTLRGLQLQSGLSTGRAAVSHANSRCSSRYGSQSPTTSSAARMHVTWAVHCPQTEVIRAIVLGGSPYLRRGLHSAPAASRGNRTSPAAAPPAPVAARARLLVSSWQPWQLQLVGARPPLGGYVLQRASVDDGLKPYVSAQRGSNKH